MIFASRRLKGFKVEMIDGGSGTLADVLFEDGGWKVRWFVVAIRDSVGARKVLIPPSVVERVDTESRVIQLTLTTAKIQGSPGIFHDQPVSLQKELDLWRYFGMDPLSGYGEHLRQIAAARASGAFSAGGISPMRATDPDGVGNVVSQLRSISAVTGYHIQAKDGAIGHVQQLLLDDINWSVSYVVVDTRDWWFGKQVVLSPITVAKINWDSRTFYLAMTRADVRSSPAWKPKNMRARAYEERLQLN